MFARVIDYLHHFGEIFDRPVTPAAQMEPERPVWRHQWILREQIGPIHQGIRSFSLTPMTSQYC